jgi:uncharacterized protein YdhG (YjbR/CyaY superfamily)
MRSRTIDQNNPAIDAYLQKLTPERQAALTEVRSLIRKTVPAAVETMKYKMPTYELNGEMICAFASQKRYMSLYMGAGLVEMHKEQLSELDVGKSCIRFKRLEQLPLDIIRRILTETVRRKESD